MCVRKLGCQNKNLMLERLVFKNPTLIFFSSCADFYLCWGSALSAEIRPL